MSVYIFNESRQKSESKEILVKSPADVKYEISLFSQQKLHKKYFYYE